MGSIIHPVTFTTSYGMLLTQRISRRRDMHKRITLGKESAEVAARVGRDERRSEDIKD
jgi:hypothetical protein